MVNGSEEWRKYLIRVAAEMGFQITAEQSRLFAAHARELMTWNKKVNLTRITDPAEIAVKHFLDCLPAAEHIPSSARVLDVGAGGGFPGIPLKIMRPDICITMIDAVRKKVSFIKHVIRQLNFENVQAVHVRAETLHTEKNLKPFDVIISRALTALDKFVQMSIPLLADGGIMLALKSRQVDAEIKDLAKEYGTGVHVEKYHFSLPENHGQRSIVSVSRPME